MDSPRADFHVDDDWRTPSANAGYGAPHRGPDAHPWPERDHLRAGRNVHSSGPGTTCRFRAADQYKTGLGTHPISPAPRLDGTRGVIEQGTAMASTLPIPSSLGLRRSSQATACGHRRLSADRPEPSRGLRHRFVYDSAGGTVGTPCVARAIPPRRPSQGQFTKSISGWSDSPHY